jgi:CHAT domain-containing protein
MIGEEAYLRFVSARDATFGVLVDADGTTPFEIKASKASLEALVAKVRRSVKRSRGRLPDYDIQSASTLYQILFAKVLDGATPLKVLHIDAGETLSPLPFSALVTAPPNAETAARIKADQNYVGVPWLASRYSVDLALGPAAFLRTRKQAGRAPFGPLLSFGGFKAEPKEVAARLVQSRKGLQTAIAERNRCDKEIETSLQGLPELPETRAEATADAAIAGPLGRAVIGADFTDTAVAEDPEVSRAQILVFATHGVLGLSDCFPEPALLTSLGPRGEGLLTASRVLDLNLHAKLVVMSACDTAGGGRTDAAVTGLTDGGEALSGLARSFIYAGARTILATQWKLSAESSGRQTKALLTLLRTGESLTSALNRTQSDLYGDPDTSHPYFWATFSLVGDGEVRFSDPPPPAA